MARSWRVNLIFGFFFVFWAVIIGSLFLIQVRNRDYWRALAQGQQLSFEQVTGDRGEVFLRDKDGVFYNLATSEEITLVCAMPEKVFIQDDQGAAVIQKTAEILGLNREEIIKQLQETENTCHAIKTRLTKDEVKRFQEANLNGVYLRRQTVRYYPHQGLLAHVVGFVGGEGSGQYGVEGYYDEELQGSSGFQTGERSPIVSLVKSSVEKGASLNLTIDYNIQQEAERLLESTKKDLKVQSGTILVSDPNTGQILALANFPAFNPNEYSKEGDFSVFQNSAIQQTFEPGSTFKLITMAAALDANKVTPQTTYVDKGFVQIGQDKLSNFGERIWGEQTMTGVLERSINTGAIFAQEQTGDDKFIEYVENFGFFEQTGIDLQGEVYSLNKNLKSLRKVNLATASFGQGIEITSIQLVRAVSAIANNGKLPVPYVVEKPESAITAGKEVISQKTSSQLTAMLVSVVENGSGKTAGVPGYYIAGKTGTAQVPWTSLGIQKSGYSDNTIQTFIGYAPAFNPRFVILVKLDNPDSKTAEYSAAPVFQEMAKYIIDYWQIPPDYEAAE